MNKFKIVLIFIRDCIQILLILGGGSYLFLSLCNWTCNIGEWGWFSRFLFGLMLFCICVIFWDWSKDFRNKFNYKSK